MKIISTDEKHTKNIAKDFAKTLKPGDVVLLYGEMGAGKTVFAKGFAAGLGIEDEITSPTYTYVSIYGNYFYHFDCYRLTGGAQAEAMGLDEYFYAGGICLIEWAQNIESILPPHAKKVIITKTGDNAREIEFVDR